MKWVAGGALVAPLLALSISFIGESIHQDLYLHGDLLRSAEIWSGSSWSRTADLPHPIAYAQLAPLADGSAMLIEDAQDGLHALRWSGDAWAPAGAIAFRDRRRVVPLRGGRLLVAGEDLADVYERGAWRSIAWPSHVACFAEIDGGVLAVTFEPLAKKRNRAWLDLREIGEPPETPSCALAALEGGRALLAYEDDTGEQTATRLALYESGEFRRLPAVLEERAAGFIGALTRVLPDGRVALVIDGGEHALLWDPRSGRVTDVPGPPRPGHPPAYALLDGARVFATGGSIPTGDERRDERDAQARRDAIVWDLSNGALTPAAPMLQSREFHAMARLSDGRVLVAGGHGASGHFVIDQVAKLAGAIALALALLAGGAFAFVRARRRIAAFLLALLGAAISAGVILLWAVSQFRYPG